MQLRKSPRKRTTAVLKADSIVTLLLRVLLVLSVVNLIPNVLADGKFEVTLREVWNPRGKVSTGQCCGVNGMAADGRCTASCRTFFSACLGPYGRPAGSCIYGQEKTHVLGDNSFSLKTNNTLQLEIAFSWLGSFSLLLEARDKVSGNSSKLIEQVRVQRQSLVPSSKWKHVTHIGSVANMSFSYRMVCNKDFYGNGCSTRCTPRDDRFGHYTCNANGTRVCKAGWSGSFCDKAICRSGCNRTNGYCNAPGECRCYAGWQGALCEKCVRYPGCVHGTCTKPFECNCQPGWGNIYCDLALDPCGREDPCKNGASCKNIAPGRYKCFCRKGFKGTNCEKDINECSTNPCEHGGACTDLVGDFNCTCAAGYRGKTCSININDCTPDACFNGGTCVDGVGNFTCHCPDGFTGDMCECPLPTSPGHSSKRSTLNSGASGEVDVGSRNKSANGTEKTAENGSTVIGSSKSLWDSFDDADKEKLIIAITVSVIIGVCLIGSCLLWKHIRKRSRCVRNREGAGSESGNSEHEPKGKSLDDKEASCATATNAGPQRVTLNNQAPADIIINFIPTRDSAANVNTLKEQNLNSCNKTAEKELMRKSVELSQITDPADWDEFFLPNRCTFDKGYWQEVEVEI